MNHKIINFLKISAQKIIALIQRIILRKTIIIVLSIFIGFVILLFVFRQPIVKAIINHKLNSFNAAYQADLQIGDFSFKGITAAEISNISLKPIKGDTLLKIESLYAKVSFWNLLIFKVNLTDFKLQNARFSIVKTDSLDNYSFLLKRNSVSKDNEGIQNITKESDYASAVQRLLNAVFYKIPSNIEILNFEISSFTDGHLITMKLPELKLIEHQFNSMIEITENNKTSHWSTEGVIKPAENLIKIKVYASDNLKVKLPFTEYKWKGLIAFDTISFSFNGNRSEDGITIINGVASVNGLLINHSRVSVSDVFLNNASIEYQLNVGEDYFELDSNSVAVFNKLILHPYFYYRPNPCRQIALKLHKEKFPAQDLFESLPKGLFINLEGIQTKGELAYNLDFFVDIDNPDSIIFESDLKRYNFSILKNGATNFSKMNEAFLYTAFEKGEAVRSFIVGSENPNFRRLDEISPYLKNAVLTSEDGAFFWHRGFLPESFKESITKNIKTNRFARGGSTISMQLVKNVFLNRNKTIARKLEEALIVWLIENNGLTSKERMFEVYLNIIEWGPMVYGANEASHFYFSKDASKLTLAEALFLTSMIPHPKWFSYSFDGKGNLKPYLADYYSFVSKRMLKKEMITQEDFDKLLPQIDVKGPAKSLIIRTDSIPANIDLLIE
ncbi:MAG: transglycosylase domain-containing protein [Bacteroidetes bacterium]|nr:transglycosylase domain-containing protein [Bacteroidota bacterium]